jgi:hypothetical protein
MTTWAPGWNGRSSMDPPPEGCRLCGSTWGAVWQPVEGTPGFFCCELCATEYVRILDEVRQATGWGTVSALELSGNRWGRVGRAQNGRLEFRFTVAFTPEGDLRSFVPRPSG